MIAPRLLAVAALCWLPISSAGAQANPATSPPAATPPASTEGGPDAPASSGDARTPAGTGEGSAQRTNVDAERLKEASERYGRALRSYDDGNYDAALVEFQRAYEIAPTFRILYNLGVVSLALRDYASALTYFERYLAEGGGQVSTEQRSEVERKMRDLAAHVGQIEVTVNVERAEIRVDDRVIGTSPLRGPLRLNAGARRISARAPGRLPDSRFVDLAGGDRLQVELSLVDPRAERSAASSPAQRPDAPEPTETVARPFPWLPWAGTALLAGAAIYTGLEALGTHSDYEDARERPGTSRHTLDRLDRKATRLGLAADVFGLGALALGAYSVYVTLNEPHDEPKNQALKPRYELGFGPNRVTLHGSF